MATQNFLTFQPRVPELEEVDINNVEFRYTKGTDTAFVHWFGRERHAIILDIDDHISVRIDPATQDIVGLQIEAFMEWFVVEHPEFLPVAEQFGVDPMDIEAARRKIEPQRAKVAALGSLLDQVQDSLQSAVA